MQCDVCQRSASSTLPFNCTLCARDILYQPRLKHAQILLEKESIEKQVEQSVSSSPKPIRSSSSPGSKKQDPNSAWTVQRASADQTTSEEQIQTIHSHIQTLRQETQNMRADIAARKARLLRRRSELASAKQELSHSQGTAQEPLEKSIRRTTHRWDILHTKTAESRLLLCKEAARLYSLQHHKRKKGVRGRDVYTIGGTPIIDLRDLNNASPTEITVSANHVAHLLHVTSHYLSLKLPAEITLPHKDYPTPTIFSPSSSYTTTRDVPFPGSTPSHSPEASRHKEQQHSNDTRPLPRPRVLNLEKPLPVLAKDDQLAYANFVEAMTFLAWDVAWLCRTQGLPVGQNNWEDICAMGRNLYQLLLAPPSLAARPPLPSPSPSIAKIPLHTIPQTNSAASPRILSSKPATSNPTAPVPAPIREKGQTPPPPPAPGHYSHNTTYAFLSAAMGTEYMRAWRLASAVKAVERIKGMLLAERTGAEWEILEGEEWAGAVEEAAEEAEIFEQRQLDGGGELGMGQTGVLVKPTSKAGGREVERDTGLGSEMESAGGKERERANGWMKVKSRSGGEGEGNASGSGNGGRGA